MKTKILFVIDSLNSGGAEKSLLTLLNLLNANKYEIELMLSAEGGLYSNLLPIDVLVQKIPIRTKLSILRKYIYSISLRINRTLKLKFHPAQIHWKILSGSYRSPSKVYDVAIAYSQGLPTYYVADYVHAKHKYAWVNTNYSLAGYNPKFDKSKYSNFTKIITVSIGAKKIFLDKHPYLYNKTQVISDLISKNMIWNMGGDKDPYNFDDSIKKILTIGRLVNIKGYDLAISAASDLKNAGINFKWYIIGEGMLERQLKVDISDLGLKEYFVFLGTFANPYPFIKYCDIYCQTSRFEGFGLAIAEARVLGRPIVATNFEGVKNQIRHAENGLITQMDGVSISNGIQLLLKDANLYKKIMNNLLSDEVDSLSELKKIEELLDV